ncbi:MAG: cytochrome [Pusillimonas sp.]|nr:cytochrome [Pusillimonas sp.]MBC43228.1 cytochrome [Pusillimonas sp.]|tara:strand:+ start:29639 stop:30862 length:1224 start_codon:yes stop_codon:yes gene_type:complete
MSRKELNATGTSFDLFNVPDDYYDNPYPYFKDLRDNDPLHWNSDGSVLVTRYEDVKTVWRDLTGVVNREKMYTEKFGEGPLLEHHTRSMLFRDPPDHDRLRDVVNPFFTPRRINGLTDTIREIVLQLLDEIEEKKEIDFVKDFASLIPIKLICDLLGVPREEGPRIRDYGAKVLLPLNPAVSQETIQAGHEGTRDFMAFLAPYVKDWQSRPVEEEPSNIISGMVAAQKRGERISDSELIHMCILVLNGGHETTTNLLGLSTLALLGHPEQSERLVQDPSLIGLGVEECLRYATPLQLQGRRTTRQVEISTGVIPPDTEVIIAQASANRDERVFSEPNRFILDRRPNSHLSFGAGIHVCLGRPLARLEVAVTLPLLLNRFPNMEVIGKPEFNRNARFRGISSMAIRLN